MWQLLLLQVISCINFKVVQSAWVEISQVPTNTPTPFVFASPKISFIAPKTTTEVPPGRKRFATTAKIYTTTWNYKDLVTSTTVTPLTTTEETIDDEQELKSSKNEENSFDGFVPLLKNIQDTLTANAKKTLKSKIDVLANLRDNLLVNIDERMSALWHKSDPELRQARTHEDEHEMDFPSNEGALLTIGFLTFAVFLIKLVMKLIHALKEKQNMAMVVTTMAPAAAFIGRKKRDAEEQDTAKLLQLLEEYEFK